MSIEKSETEVKAWMLARSMEKVQARCAQCGTNWELHRGDAFMCPMCATAPRRAYLSSNVATFLDLDQ